MVRVTIRCAKNHARYFVNRSATDSSESVSGKISFSRILYSSLSTCHLYSHSDVLHGLSTRASDVDPTSISSTERLHLVHCYVTSSPSDGGLGIHPDNDAWSRVESIMALHDPEFNDRWMHSVTHTIDIGRDQLDFIRSQVRASILFHMMSPHSCSSEMPSHFTSRSWLPTLITSSLSLSLAS